MINHQPPKAMQDVLTRAYAALKFTPDEIKGVLNDLAGIHQMAVFNELLKSLTESEVAELNKNFASKSEEDKKTRLKQSPKFTVGAKILWRWRTQRQKKRLMNILLT